MRSEAEHAGFKLHTFEIRNASIKTTMHSAPKTRKNLSPRHNMNRGHQTNQHSAELIQLAIQKLWLNNRKRPSLQRTCASLPASSCKRKDTYPQAYMGSFHAKAISQHEIKENLEATHSPSREGYVQCQRLETGLMPTFLAVTAEEYFY